MSAIELDLQQGFSAALKDAPRGLDAIRVQLHSNARILALFGRSGAGKSSVLKMIAGLSAPDTGRIVIDGVTLADTARGIALPMEARGIGMVFQEAYLFPHLSVRDNLTFGAQRARARAAISPTAAPRFALDDIAALLGITALLQRRPQSLSGGEKQRVAIGRALLSSPALLLMDEPLASLDVRRRGELLHLIERVRDELGVRIIYVSHSIGEVTRLADEVALLHEGRLLACGPTETIFNRADLREHTGRYEGGALIEAVVHAHDTRYFMSTLRVGVAANGFDLVAPGIDVPVGTRVRLRIRARDVTLATARPQGISVRNILPGHVASIAHSGGAIAEVRVTLGPIELPARLSRLSVEELGLAVGQAVYVLVKAIAFDKRSMGLTA